MSDLRLNAPNSISALPDPMVGYWGQEWKGKGGKGKGEGKRKEKEVKGKRRGEGDNGRRKGK